MHLISIVHRCASLCIHYYMYLDFLIVLHIKISDLFDKLNKKTDNPNSN